MPQNLLKDLQSKILKPRKKSQDFFRRGETKDNPQSGAIAAAGFELVSTRDTLHEVSKGAAFKSKNKRPYRKLFPDPVFVYRDFTVRLFCFGRIFVKDHIQCNLFRISAYLDFGRVACFVYRKRCAHIA